MPSPLLLPDPAADETDRLLAELEKRIHKEYKQAIKEADKKWRDYLSAFDAQDKVEAERLAKGEITKAEYQDWRRRHLAQGKHWEEMRNVMAQDYHNRNLIAAKLADKSMADVYAVNANYGTYMIEHSGKFDTGFTLYNHDSAEALLKEEWAINPETGRNSFLPPPKPGGKRARELEGLRTTNPDVLWNAKNIQSAMMQGVLSGESMTSLARRLAGVAEMDERQAIRNARTLTTNVQNKGRMDAGDRIKNLGGEMVDEWSAILDGRTRHSHRHMHGERKDHDSEEPFSNGCRWPGDPAGPAAEVYNCRCRVKLWAKGFEGETIKHSDAMGDMSFKEWQNEKLGARVSSSANSSVSARNTAAGKPSAVIGGASLNNRQKRIISSLLSDGDRVIINKKDVSMRDLSALSAHEGVEFALLTRKSERMVIRGTEQHVNAINGIAAREFAKEGWKWSGHTHVVGGLIPSEGDRLVLERFNQDRSVIYDAAGRFGLFYRK